MVRHIVIWTLKDEAHGKTKAENILIIKKKILALLGQIEGLTEIEVGINVVGSGDISLCSTHVDFPALELYQKHPAHVEVGAYVKEASESRLSCDYEV